MMAVMTMQQNMGMTDRWVRGGLGLAMLLHGMGLIGRRHPFEALVGGAFLFYGLSGFDPLLKAIGVTTIPGDENSVVNRMKQNIPGYGTKPITTQQPMPMTQRKTPTTDSGTTVADELSMGE